jgi:hypothetical protein
VEQTLYLRTGCDKGKTRPASMPGMTGYKTGTQPYTERRQIGANNKGGDIKSNQVRATNRPVRTVQAIRMRIARDAALALMWIGRRRGYGEGG